MIRNIDDLRYYIKEDRVANGLLPLEPGFKNWLKYRFKLYFDKRIRFHTVLRLYEYYSNRKSILLLPLKIFYFYKFKNLSYILGFTIHKNCFGPGLCIKHYGSIVVNPNTKIGKNCTIHSCVNIGETNGKAPVIGDDVYIGPGAKIFGNIFIANSIKIGANAVVNKSFIDENVALGGVPAKIIKHYK